jgi:hypothetical protein
MHEFLSIKSDKFTFSIMWYLFHTLKFTALTEKFGHATAVLSPHMAYFHRLLLFFIVMHQHRPWTASPLKSYSTKLYFTDGEGIHTLRSNLADIQEISTDQYFGGLKEHIFFLYTWRLGTTVAQWLRYCATNQKVAGSIPLITLWPWGRLSL